MGKGVPGGYVGMGTPGTDKGKDFCTHYHTRHTHTRHTHTHHGGFTYICWVKKYMLNTLLLLLFCKFKVIFSYFLLFVTLMSQVDVDYQ